MRTAGRIANLISDKGSAGQDFQDLVTGTGLHLIRPDRRDEASRHASIGWIRLNRPGESRD